MSRHSFLTSSRLTRQLRSVGFGTTLLVLAAGALAQGTTPSGTGTTGATGSATKAGSGTLDRADRNFIEDAAMGGMAEVALGKLAQQRATDAQVKSFGDRMAQDHGKANDELMALASGKGVQPPAALDKSHQRDADKLSKLSGAEFDRAYMKQMVDDHKKTISKFEKASKSAKDPEVKAFATKTLPTLQSHLQMAQTTHDALRNTKGGSTMGGGKSGSGSGTGTSGSGNMGAATGTGSTATGAPAMPASR